MAEVLLAAARAAQAAANGLAAAPAGTSALPPVTTMLPLLQPMVPQPLVPQPPRQADALAARGGQAQAGLSGDAPPPPARLFCVGTMLTSGLPCAGPEPDGAFALPLQWHHRNGYVWRFRHPSRSAAWAAGDVCCVLKEITSRQERGAQSRQERGPAVTLPQHDAETPGCWWRKSRQEADRDRRGPSSPG